MGIDICATACDRQRSSEKGGQTDVGKETVKDGEGGQIDVGVVVDNDGGVPRIVRRTNLRRRKSP